MFKCPVWENALQVRAGSFGTSGGRRESFCRRDEWSIHAFAASRAPILMVPHFLGKLVRGFRDFIVRNCSWRFAIVSCYLLGVYPLAAEPMRLTGQAIKTTLPGSVLKLDTPLGTVVPISFGGNGIMSGDAGELASYLGSQKDRGRYWLTEDRICYKWFRWFSGEQHCLSIARDGKKIFWKRDDGETGTATLEEHHKAPSEEQHKARKEHHKAPPARAWNTIAKQVPQKLPEPTHAIARRTVTTVAAYDTQNVTTAAVDDTQSVTTASAADTQSADEPVLIKLPTLAVRPHKRTTDVASEEEPGLTTLVKLPGPSRTAH